MVIVQSSIDVWLVPHVWDSPGELLGLFSLNSLGWSKKREPLIACIEFSQFSYGYIGDG
ncbi:TPA: hypothetical protein PXS20_002302 [Yersinia enterocolitica]|nr:hypothetical protein [Yersinia enterocolitica]HDL8551846.1 hypothetical protein [Yersinia enterocolitica]